MQKMGFSVEERKAIYCHELGHIFSKNQLSDKNRLWREIDDEIDSDTFAVKECKVEPEILEGALKKTYEYEINQITKKENMTQERIEAMRRRYPPGTEVTLNSMEGESHMPPGLKGKVDMVDDAGQIHVNWENGSSLALVPGVDSFHITDLPRAERPKQQPSR